MAKSRFPLQLPERSLLPKKNHLQVKSHLQVEEKVVLRGGTVGKGSKVGGEASSESFLCENLEKEAKEMEIGK